MVLKATKFIFSFVFQIVDEVDILPRLMFCQDVSVENFTLLAELDPGVSTNETIILKIRN